MSESFFKPSGQPAARKLALVLAQFLDGAVDDAARSDLCDFYADWFASHRRPTIVYSRLFAFVRQPTIHVLVMCAQKSATVRVLYADEAVNEIAVTRGVNLLKIGPVPDGQLVALEFDDDGDGGLLAELEIPAVDTQLTRAYVSL